MLDMELASSLKLYCYEQRPKAKYQTAGQRSKLEARAGGAGSPRRKAASRRSSCTRVQRPRRELRGTSNEERARPPRAQGPVLHDDYGAVTVEHDSDEHVGIGSIIEIADEDNEKMEVEISALGGVAPGLPLGAALMGSAIGDVVDVEGRRAGRGRRACSRSGARSDGRWAQAGDPSGFRRTYVTNENGVPFADTWLSRDVSSKAWRSHDGKNVSPSTSRSISVSSNSSATGVLPRRPPLHRSRSPVACPEQLEGVVERACALCPSAAHVSLRVTTTLRRPGSGRKRSGSESQVRRPITTGCPIVSPESAPVLGELPGERASTTDHRRARPRPRARASNTDA